MRSWVVAALAVLLLAGSAVQGLATPVNYGDFLGADLDYLGVTENSPTDPTPLFEAPTRVGDSLLFFPTNYAATSVNGIPDVTVGILTFELQATNGNTIDSLAITELGDYLLTTPGTGTSTATVGGALIITVLDVFGVPVDFNPTIHFQSDSLVSTPAAPFVLQNDFFEANIFTASALIDLASVVPGATRIQVQFNNILSASSTPGTTAFIQKKSINGAVVIEPNPSPGPIVPEPSSAILALGALVIGAFGRFWRRRRPRL